VITTDKKVKMDAWYDADSNTHHSYVDMDGLMDERVKVEKKRDKGQMKERRSVVQVRDVKNEKSMIEWRWEITRDKYMRRGYKRRVE
jgi:hypothetical protein